MTPSPPSSTAAPATAPVDDAAVVAVAKTLNCPICQGRNLVDCPLPVCAEMRADIRTQLAQGRSPEAIVQHFVDYYGPAVRNTPPLVGLLGLAWWVPLVVVVGGSWAVGHILRRQRPGARGARAIAAAEGDATAEAVARSASAAQGDLARYAAELERLAFDGSPAPSARAPEGGSTPDGGA